LPLRRRLAAGEGNKMKNADAPAVKREAEIGGRTPWIWTLAFGHHADARL
jgi:hypothetical protein